MVDVAPFRALRWKSSASKADISQFICPPYDIIFPADQASLLRRSRENVVRLELPQGTGMDKYRRAATALNEWKKIKRLIQDEEPQFYLLETTYRSHDPFAPAQTLKRVGVLVALRLEVPGKGAIRPHEKTLSKAKEDRLHLLTAVATNVSPVFGLFFDKKKEWPRWVREVSRKKPDQCGIERASLKHRMWVVKEAAHIKALRRMLNRKDLYIADGHHRYEVAWTYQDIQMEKDPAAGLGAGWRFVMTYICPMEEPGLLMLPTHRLVQVRRSFKDLKEYLSRLFDMVPVKNMKILIKNLQSVRPGGHAIGWVTAQGLFELQLKSTISLDLCLGRRPAVLRNLDAVMLHDIILEESSGVPYIKDQDIYFTQDIGMILKKVRQNPLWMGFVLRSAGVQSLSKVAEAGEVMPPKTTYFYPKVPTGFTLMPLDQKIG